MLSSESRVFITNLAKYNAGELYGEWFDLSEGKDAMTEVLKRVLGSDEEYFISDYEADFQINEYDNLFELAEFVGYYKDLSDFDKTLVIYMLDNEGIDKDEVLDKIQADSLADNYILYEASDEYELGVVYAQEALEIPENLYCYIDYEKIGHDLVCNGAVHFEGYYILAC